MSNLFGIGLSGLAAAQAGLATASDNISNVNTPGFTRRQAELSETVSGSGGAGVTVTSIQRQYAGFLTQELNQAQSTNSATSSHLSQASQIDDLLGDSTTGLGPRLQDFFDSLSTLAGTPANSSARSAVLGSAQDLASRFRAFADTFDNMKKSVQSSLAGDVDTVNQTAQQIAKLNTEIVSSSGSVGGTPNQLLDQRDQLVANLSQQINVQVSQDNQGRTIVTVAGNSLVDASGSHSLALTTDPNDSTQQQLAAVEPDGSKQIIPDARVTGGNIGGLLAFNHQTLASAQANLDQTAHVLASAVNAQNEQGVDLNGKPGGPLFTVSSPAVEANASNSGDAQLSASFVPGQSAQVTADNYTVQFKNGAYQVTTQPGGQSVATKGDGSNSNPLTFNGLSISVSGTPKEGDSFLVRPVAGAAADFNVATSDPAAIAAAGAGGGPGDNKNATALANLAQANIIEGNRSATENYAQLVQNVGNTTQSLTLAGQSQTSLTNDLTQAQQSISGVNLDEENVHLMYYQQMYQANARVIQTASTVFNALLGING